MAPLAAAVTDAVILAEGRRGFLRRMSDPFWFQSFGAVLGMDWHSSGITTAVMGALSRGLAPRAKELGLWVCGGRGRYSRRTPGQLLDVAERTGLDGGRLVRASKLVAKVDSVALQDGFSLYLHNFIVTERGDWVVVQQGMNGDAGQARRYHWRSEAVRSFVEEPHDAVVGPPQGTIVNLTDQRAATARDATVDITGSNPDVIVDEVRKAAVDRLQTRRHVQMPVRHEVRPTDVFLRRLHGVLAVAREQGASDFEDLLLTAGLGARCLQALALVAEVAYGAPSRFDDPARFAFAHGGKDGHPFPVPLKVYDRTIGTLHRALNEARIGRGEKMRAFKRLEQRARQLEQAVSRRGGPSFQQIVDHEWQQSSQRGGMTGLGPASSAVRKRIDEARSWPMERQLKLFG